MEDRIPNCIHDMEAALRATFGGIVERVSGGGGGGCAPGWEDHLGTGCASWEGFVIEDIMRRELLAHPFTQCFFWRTATGQEVDLVLDRGNRRIAIEIKANSAGNPHDARKLEAMLDDIGASEGWLVGMGRESIQLNQRVRSVSLDQVPNWLP